MRRQTKATTTDTHYEKTTGESSTDKHQCDNCGRWYVNLSNHRKCSGRSQTISSTEVRNARQPDDKTSHSHSGTARKDALKQKALQPKDNILQVCDMSITD